MPKVEMGVGGTISRNIWGDTIEHMSLQTFQSLVESLKDLPELKRVIFTSFGEPFAHPQLLDMIEAVRKFDLAVTVGTRCGLPWIYRVCTGVPSAAAGNLDVRGICPFSQRCEGL